MNKYKLKRKKEVANINKEILNENISQGVDLVNKYNINLKKQREDRLIKKDQNVYLEDKKTTYNKIRPIVICIIMILIVVLIFLFITYGKIFGININKNILLEDTKKVEFVTGENDIYTKYDNEFLIYSNQIISTYNSNGQKSWEYRIDAMFTPDIYVQGKYMIVSNNSNGTLYLFESKREILNKKIEGTIKKIYLDEEGNFAIEHSSNGFKKIITVFGKNGEEKYNTYIESGAIIDIKLIENASKMIVTQTNATSFKIGIKISIVDGTRKTENIKVLAKLDNNMVYDLTISGQDIIMLLDNKLIKLNSNTGSITEIKTFDSNQLLYIALAENYYIIVEKELNTQFDKYMIKTAKFDNTIIGNFEIDNSPKFMKNSGVLNYFSYQNKVQVVNKWAIDVKNLSIDFPPKDIIVFDNEKSAALIYTNKIYILNI